MKKICCFLIRKQANKELYLVYQNGEKIGGVVFGEQLVFQGDVSHETKKDIVRNLLSQERRARTHVQERYKRPNKVAQRILESSSRRGQYLLNKLRELVAEEV